MSLANRINSDQIDNVDPGYISESQMEQLCTAILVENLTPEELQEALTESSGLYAVTESQKNIVRLNKAAKLNRAYKVAVLQCASEDRLKDYKKLRTLWKMEAYLFNKLEKRYRNKAMARAREAIKKLKRTKSNPIVKAAERAGNALGTAAKQLNSKLISTFNKK